MRIISVLLAAALVATPAVADVIAPAGPGNAQGPAPFRFYGSGGSRVQQIYSSSFFSGPQSISAVSFRAFPGFDPSFLFGNTLNISNVTIGLGTSMASGNDVSGLPSATFANNISNAQTVYSGALSISTAAMGANRPFDYTVNFMNPFIYDPSLGSLVLDVLIPTTATVSGNGALGFLTFDNANTLNDGLFSVVNVTDGGSATGIIETSGAITKFTSASVAGAVPEPATWAMLILGFASVGAAVRRRRARPVSLTA